MIVLGICTDVIISAAALIVDGQIVCAVPEERLNRQKRFRGFPSNAIVFCLRQAGYSIHDVDYIAVGWNPGRHIKRYNQRYSSALRWRSEYFITVPNSLMSFSDDKQILSVEQSIHFKGSKCKIVFVDHHLAHAANGYFLSPFEEAAVFVSDGRGEDKTILYATGKNGKITEQDTVAFPHSIGSLYASFTEFLGFRADADEWKVMALASYAQQKNFYYKKIKKLISFLPNGQVELDLTYFNYYLLDQLAMYSDKFIHEFGKPRDKDEPLNEKHYQIASALQLVIEEILFECLEYHRKATKLDRIVLSGGVFMNSVLNGKILSKTGFKDIFISPSPDDSGTSIGAAQYVYYEKTGSRKKKPNPFIYTGPEFSNEEIKNVLKNCKIEAEYVEEIEEITACLLAEGNVVGWVQGKMEFGQRALGNRSILADPTNESMRDKLINIKSRENFRPFAVSILEEEVGHYFEIPAKNSTPFMERVLKVKKDMQSLVPVITHVNGTSRVQTVNKKSNLRYYSLISKFRQLKGVPCLLNTSFNLSGEPIVCSPLDALKSFFSCGLDVLVVENYLIKKNC